MVGTLLSNAGGVSAMPGQRAKVPYALQAGNQNIKQKYCNRFYKDFKNGPHKNLKQKSL